MADLLKHASHHTYYPDEFGRSALKGVSRNTGELTKMGSHATRSLGMGGDAGPNIHSPPPHCVTTSNLVILRQRVYP